MSPSVLEDFAEQPVFSEPRVEPPKKQPCETCKSEVAHIERKDRRSFHGDDTVVGGCASAAPPSPGTVMYCHETITTGVASLSSESYLTDAGTPSVLHSFPPTSKRPTQLPSSIHQLPRWKSNHTLQIPSVGLHLLRTLVFRHKKPNSLRPWRPRRVFSPTTLYTTTLGKFLQRIRSLDLRHQTSSFPRTHRHPWGYLSPIRAGVEKAHILPLAR